MLLPNIQSENGVLAGARFREHFLRTIRWSSRLLCTSRAGLQAWTRFAFEVISHPRVLPVV